MFINEQFKGCSEAFYDVAYAICNQDESMFNFICGMDSLPPE